MNLDTPDLYDAGASPVEEDDEFTEFDRLGTHLAQLMRETLDQEDAFLGPMVEGEEVLGLLREGSPNSGSSMVQQMDALMTAFNRGTRLANEADEEAAEEAAAHERLLQENLARVVFVGSTGIPEAFSIWGFDAQGRNVCTSHDGGQVKLAMGPQGIGKTVAAMLEIEAAIQPLVGITSAFHRRTAAFSFFVDLLGNKLPQALFGLWPNTNPIDLDILVNRLGAQATPLSRLNLAVPTWLMDSYQARLGPYLCDRLRIAPLRMGFHNINQSSLEALIGAEDDAQYVHIMLDMAQDRGDDLTMSDWHQVIDDNREMNSTARLRAHRRLRLLDQLIAPGADLWQLGGPDELTVFCLGGRWIRRRDVAPVIVALLNGLVEQSPIHGPFQRLFHLDEYNYFDHDPLVRQHLLMVARLIRHLGSTLWIAGQDFLSMPDELLGLSTMFLMFRILSRKIYEHIRERRIGFDAWSFAAISQLEKSTAVLAVNESSDPLWRMGGQKIWFRRMCCAHGGHTKAEV